MKTISKISIILLVFVFLISACTPTQATVTESEGSGVDNNQEAIYNPDGYIWYRFILGKRVNLDLE